MYKDIIYKINIHKQRIIDSFIKRGIYPNNELINSQLSNIEMRTSIFKSYDIKTGDRFDVQEFNSALKDIYCDLNILYKLLNDVIEQEYMDLNNYIIAHVNELDTRAKSYLKKANLESMSTSLGDSILFKHNDFDILSSNNDSIVELGELEIEDASKIICLANINNIDYSDLVFDFKSKDNTISVNAYNYNHDSIIMPGIPIRKSYNVSLNDIQKINGSLALPVVINDSNKGEIKTLAGKNKMLCKSTDNNDSIILSKAVDITSMNIQRHTYIDFYVVDGKSISFKFNKKPLSTNFNYESGYVDNLNYIHHFFIECDEGFVFSIELEKGSIYAINEDTIIEQNKIYYSGQVDVKDFLIIHSYSDNKQKYSINMKVINKTIDDDDIESVLIKKIE